jgi:hypothetical protein
MATLKNYVFIFYLKKCFIVNIKVRIVVFFFFLFTIYLRKCFRLDKCAYFEKTQADLKLFFKNIYIYIYIYNVLTLNGGTMWPQDNSDLIRWLHNQPIWSR